MHTALTAAEMNTTARISNQSTTLSAINCSDVFLASNGVCLPRCDKWKQYPEDISKAIDVVVIIYSAVTVVVGIIALVASCVNWRKM